MIKASELVVNGKYPRQAKMVDVSWLFEDPKTNSSCVKSKGKNVCDVESLDLAGR